jgi:N-acetylglucosaminyldiphosphoundecaprenol N-acetyl-beta-D-mannosaminyltransferase
MYEHREKIRGTIILASGGTFDVFSGRGEPAPAWIREVGFEWLYRLTKDIRGLWARCLIYNLIFVVMFTLQLTGLRSYHAMTEGAQYN